MSAPAWLRKIPRWSAVALVAAAWVGWSSCASPSVHLPWLSDTALARDTARRQGRPILMDFTGSDYCAPCQKLAREIYDTPTFARYAASNLVLLIVDFPAWKELPPAQTQANQALADQFKIEGYPTVVLVDSEMREIGRFTDIRAGTPAEFIADVEKLIHPTRLR